MPEEPRSFEAFFEENHPRGFTVMADDPTGDRVILFGGAEGLSQEPQGDTWALDVGTGEWTELDPASAPGPRAWP